MLQQRLRSSDDESLIYHYCSAETLIAIVQNRTLRFSDMNMLNDAEEGRWGYSVFEDAATNLIKRTGLPDEAKALIEGLDINFMDEVDAIWSTHGLRFCSVLSCFSIDGDSLSQWRAYADDGRGFAVGFRVSELRRMPVQILDVLYDHGEQVREVEIALAAVYMEFVEKGKDPSQDWFRDRVATIAATAAAYKNPAWREEQEVRCMHLLTSSQDEGVWSLKDDGGVAAGVEVEGQPVKFQARDGSLVPFIDMPFEVSPERSPIVEIVTGPRCPNADGNIRFLLGSAGYGPIDIRAAGVAYR